MKNGEQIEGYRYDNAECNASHTYLVSEVERILGALPTGPARRLFDLGCGNGAVAKRFAAQGWDVTGVDPSEEGIRLANRTYPELRLRRGSCYDNLANEYGTFPVVLSLEVVEHVYAPRDYAACLYALVETGGVAVLSTPYHGYIKNLIMAMTGKMDAHFTALWDHGHIKFWSMATLSQLLREAGFRSVEFRRVGRIPCVAKAMIAIARK